MNRPENMYSKGELSTETLCLGWEDAFWFQGTLFLLLTLIIDGCARGCTIRKQHGFPQGDDKLQDEPLFVYFCPLNSKDLLTLVLFLKGIKLSIAWKYLTDSYALEKVQVFLKFKMLCSENKLWENMICSPVRASFPNLQSCLLSQGAGAIPDDLKA